MTPHDSDLVAGKALGVLSPGERTRLEKLLAKDGVAAAKLEAMRATVSELEAGVARTRPPDDLFDRILAEVEPTASTTTQAEPAAEAEASPRRRRWLPRLTAGGTAAVAAVVIGFALDTGGGRGEPDARAAVTGAAQFTGLKGEVKLFSPERTEGVVVLDLESLPPPPSGHHYQVWLVRKEGGGVMEAVGSFTPTGTDAELEFRLPGPGDYSAVDVSVELDGGPPGHSGVSLAGGRFGS